MSETKLCAVIFLATRNDSGERRNCSTFLVQVVTAALIFIKISHPINLPKYEHLRGADCLKLWYFLVKILSRDGRHVDVLTNAQKDWFIESKIIFLGRGGQGLSTK